jgi:hypothetical protein
MVAVATFITFAPASGRRESRRLSESRRARAPDPHDRPRRHGLPKGPRHRGLPHKCSVGPADLGRGVNLFAVRIEDTHRDARGGQSRSTASDIALPSVLWRDPRQFQDRGSGAAQQPSESTHAII